MNEGNIYKAKITTSRGTFEFEGSQDFVEKQVERIVDIEKTAPASPTPEVEQEQKQQKKQKTTTNGSTGRKSTVEQPKMLPNLVANKEQIDSLKALYTNKSPESHMEIYAVLTYWLKENLQIAEASIDEMWTLYKVLQIKAPKAIIQTFRDGKSKKAYFEAGATSGKYYLTPIGETFVEHDLPHLKKK